MYFRKFKSTPWLVLVLCTILLLPTTGFASSDEVLKKTLFSSFNRISRDYHSVQLAIEEGTDFDAALARQDAGISDFRRLLSDVDTFQQMDLLLDELKAFGYRVRNKSEVNAFNEGYNNIEERLNYLIQTENREFNRFTPVLARISKEFTESHKQLDNSDIVQRLAAVKAIETQALAQAPRRPSKKLGAHVVGGKTSFAVYAPAATKVDLHLFDRAKDKTGKRFSMKKDAEGIWSTRLNGELYGKFYGYTVDGPKGNGYLFDKTRLLSDPYAYANVDHDGKSIVVDRRYKWKNTNFKRPAARDAIIYEMHIKDFTAHKSSGVKPSLRGKYLGMLEGKGTSKVLGHLKELGVNVIELMPVHEFDDNFAGVVNHWGYMTSHFFAPECSYASGKNGEAVKELKALIDGLHGEGFAVVLDVVYNHTAEGNHEGLPLNLKGFDNPGYYRLMPNDKRYYWNGTGCGNEVRTENPMTAQLIIDSLKYWVNEYKVDGFRFDLGTIIDKKTMQRIIDELPKDIILTAEPWAADWNRNLWGKTDFRNTRLAKWNDDYRETMRALINGHANRNNVMTVMAGSSFWWSAKPTESLNYIEAHDGYTLADLFGKNKKKTKLAAIALLTSQGIPMIHAGQEFDRSKRGNHNSYDQDNDTNYIDWAVKEKNRDVFELYKGLINLRLKYNNFRHATALNNQSVSWLQPANGNAIGMLLKGKPDFLVLLNGDSKNWVTFNLDKGNWTVICDGNKISDRGLGNAVGTYHVPPTTGVILRR